MKISFFYVIKLVGLSSSFHLTQLYVFNRILSPLKDFFYSNICSGLLILRIFLFFGLHIFLVPHFLVIFVFSPSYLNSNLLVPCLWNRLYLVPLINSVQLNADVANELTPKHLLPGLEGQDFSRFFLVCCTTSI